MRIHLVRHRRTIVQDTRKPLRRWLHTMWWVVGQQNGAWAVGLNRGVGLGSDQTAWTWRHTLRRARVRPGRAPLTGEVEVDETCVGGGAKGGRRRPLGNKARGIIAAKIRDQGIGRIRMKRIADGASDRVTIFVREALEKGGVVVREGRTSSRSRPAHGDRPPRRLVEGRAQEASTLRPGFIVSPPFRSDGCGARTTGPSVENNATPPRIILRKYPTVGSPVLMEQ